MRRPAATDDGDFARPDRPSISAPRRTPRTPGFSLDAARACKAGDRRALERLCRRVVRPAFALKRLSGDGDGLVVYEFKQPFRDGTTHVLIQPLDFIARPAALVSRPRSHLIRKT